MMKILDSDTTSENLLHHRIYWLNQLSGERSETGILTDYLRAERYSGKNRLVQFTLPENLSQAIIQCCSKSYFSIYLLLLSAFGGLLKKYTHLNNFIVGVPFYSPIKSYEALTNQTDNGTIPLRFEIEDYLEFKDFLLHMKDTAIQAYTHQQYPFNELFDILRISQRQNRCSIYDSVVLLENIHHHPVALSNDLTISWCVNGNTITGKIEYSESLFREETIESLARHYINVIKCAIANPNVKISEISLLEADEKHQLLEKFNSNTKSYPVDQTLQSLFEEQVQQTPSRVAAIHQGDRFTYQELNAKANKLARLLRDLRIGNNDFIGIFQERSLNFLQSILAILKAGAAYVPIDSTYPVERIQYMLSNSEVKVLLTDSSCFKRLIDHLEQYPHLQYVICLDAIASDQTDTQPTEINLYSRSNFSQYSKENPSLFNSSIDRAYMLYTSGSTGSPKGAIIRHDGAINHIYAQFDALRLNQELCFLQSAPASSDISVWQFLAPLLIGGRTVIVDTETVCHPEKLFQVIQAEKLTLVELVPIVLKGLIDYISNLTPQQRSLPDLQWMMVTGEDVSVNLVNQWLSLYPSIPVVNAYGPTEAADDITQFVIETPLPESQRSVPIGKPLANLNLYVLDAKMQLVPIGVPGEICVSGIGVGDGYWQNDEKTNLSFILNPFPDAKQPATQRNLIYKTGDLGRWLPDGTIEYLGRMDHQVKIRGFRIELGEIEAALSDHPTIKEAIVVAKKAQSGDKYLVAYVVPSTEKPIEKPTESHTASHELRDFLQARLPDFMVPSAFVPIDRLPLTPSGKVDRNALPEPATKSLLSSSAYRATTPVEEVLIGIWSTVLGCDRIGIYDNFFELGGHSLLATLIISQVRQVFQLEVPLRRLFEFPTIAQFAVAIETAAQPGLEAPPIERHPHEGTLPLSFAQQRMWFLAQLEPESPFYNLPTAVHLQGKLNQSALEQTFNEILRRHEVLRTKVETVADSPVAILSSLTALLIEQVDLSDLPQNQQNAEVQRLIATEAQQPFDLTCDLLLRVKLLQLGQLDQILLLTLHHIAADGWSIGILVQEIAALYQAFCNRQPSPLPLLPIQYADFAAWQHQWLQGEVLQTQLSYWREQLTDAPAVLELPMDYPRPAIQSYQGTVHSFEISSELSRSLHQLAQQSGCTLFMTLLAAFAILLGRYSNCEDIVVGTPIANRNHTEIENLIGLFVNTLVMRTDLSGNPSVEELLTRVRDVALGAYAHQDLPFEQLVEALQPQRSLSHTPLFQVMFILQNAPLPEVELPGLSLNALESDSGTTQFDLTLSMQETPQGLIGKLEYNCDLFEPSTIARMAGHFQTVLAAIVARPQQRIAELPLLTTIEQQQFLQWNQTDAAYPQDQCIHHLFETQVQLTPDAIAVEFADQQLSYRELDVRANQLAHVLQARGVRPGVLVGIYVDRSIEMLIGLLAILKAGGAYVPLDPTYPADRLEWMLQDAQVLLLLTQEHLKTRLPLHSVPLIYLDPNEYLLDLTALNTDARETALMPPVSGVTSDNLAYVIYTSGSTGKPKGVQVLHSSVVNFLTSMQRQPGLSSTDTLL
ncbi:MAG: amino acid adenylation domain-containing protein, partial [Aphanocapsa sp. GSE-SYN-MK-11-07L]|nr:amino acid adenylation domain-containing protein [Aphanocapsa sp. GSE-SYN-MK-11-07L]